jgi:voltage-gated potassium channel
VSVPGRSPQGPPPLHPRAQALLRQPLTIRRAARTIAMATVLVTIGGGIVIHFADKANFPDIGDGLWWAVQTVTTVGYGDLVPTTTSGRIVAAVVMLAGIGFLTVITATITSAFVESARRRMEGDERQALTSRLDQIGARLDAIEASLKDRGLRGGDR